MARSFRQMAARITGINTPYFGLTWVPAKTERERAQRVLVFLEDRRVLFAFTCQSQPESSIRSVMEIRRFLNRELEDVDPESELGKDLLEMRSACRRFLSRLERLDIYPNPEVSAEGVRLGYHFRWDAYRQALEQLRQTFGESIWRMASRNSLSVDQVFAASLPGDWQ